MGGGIWCITVAGVWVGVADILLYIIILTNINIDIPILDIARGVLDIVKLSSTTGCSVAHPLSSEMYQLPSSFKKVYSCT